MQALEDLDYLAALDDDGDLSDLGVVLSEFPLPPELAKALLASCEFDCVDEMLTLAAMLTGINLCYKLIALWPAFSPLLQSPPLTEPRERSFNHLSLSLAFFPDVSSPSVGLNLS